MPEESKESKAKKLAAARKKLKEYQQRGVPLGSNTTSSYAYADSTTNSGHVSSNISERSESELQLNGSNNDITPTDIANGLEASSVMGNEVHSHLENINYFSIEKPLEQVESNAGVDAVKRNTFAEDTFSEGIHDINAIQVLITEKSQLTAELNKFRTLCREKDLEIEELRVQHNNASKRLDEVSQRLFDMQKQQEQQRSHNAELQHKLAQARAQEEDHSSHISELKQQLTLRDERLKQIDTDFKDKCNALELSQLRIRQLSDENNITNDSRVEALTQTQFMYEQQIRDLQAMVQQLTQDKEHANIQYQTYVQQLNAQVQQLNERNNELTDETTRLQDREKQCVDHIQQLEKEIQKNISKQKEVKAENAPANESLNEELQTLQERISEFEAERYEFQLKIKSQEDQLTSLQSEVKQKDLELEQIKEHLENIESEQPDKTKLLAKMESDKVAASRALIQNVELKKQLDELELRFVQLTNDKADLMNRLDSEQYTNREMHTNYGAMEERLKELDERFKFKDEEMIRLSHENEELKKDLENIKVHHIYKSEGNEDDEHPNNQMNQMMNNQNEGCDHQEHDHTHDKDHHHGGNKNEHYHHEHCKDNEHNENHDCHNKKHDGHHEHDSTDEENVDYNQSNKEEYCEEAKEESITSSSELQTRTQINSSVSKIATPFIATEEAVEKLQQRFTQLMSQCAELTEEKLRLEHLVMQLQSETETIGEYIALYQTQRRILKQREYEKAAQTAMLQAEREQMRDRLTMLNNLVHSLGMEMPQSKQTTQIKEKLLENAPFNDTSQHPDSVDCVSSMQPSCTDLEHESIKSPTTAKDFNSPESQQILHKIQDIITEIKENTKELPAMEQSVDQLNCCSGKFEVV